MPDWDEMSARLDNATHWRDRQAVAKEIMNGFRTGGIVDCTPAISRMLHGLVLDGNWQVRKVIANDLAMIEDGIFDDISFRLCNDTNAFVKQAASRSYSQRRKGRRDSVKKESAQRQLSKQMTSIREKYGDQAVDEILVVSDARYNLMAGSMAHDMRSILTHLQPAAVTLADELGSRVDKAVLKRKANRLIESLSLMKSCVADMERYTEPLPVKRCAEDIAEVLNSACEIARENIKELYLDFHMVVLELDVTDGLRLRVSRHLLVLAITNLVKNAYESFMEKRNHLRQGKILVKAAAVEDAVEITINDNGMGISQDDLKEILALIPRRRNKAKHKSTGFGVPIAHRYIKAHGGTLTYKSREDVGTTARITLPKNPTEENYE